MSIFNKAVLSMMPSGYKAGTLYSVIPDDGDGDLTSTRNSVKNRKNSDLYYEEMAVNVPVVEYETVGGCPICNLEPQATNLITYSNGDAFGFGNSYWTKSGATIEGRQCVQDKIDNLKTI